MGAKHCLLKSVDLLAWKLHVVSLFSVENISVLIFLVENTEIGVSCASCFPLTGRYETGDPGISRISRLGSGFFVLAWVVSECGFSDSETLPASADDYLGIPLQVTNLWICCYDVVNHHGSPRVDLSPPV